MGMSDLEKRIAALEAGLRIVLDKTKNFTAPPTIRAYHGATLDLNDRLDVKAVLKRMENLENKDALQESAALQALEERLGKIEHMLEL